VALTAGVDQGAGEGVTAGLRIVGHVQPGAREPGRIAGHQHRDRAARATAAIKAAGARAELVTRLRAPSTSELGCQARKRERQGANRRENASREGAKSTILALPNP